MTVTCVMLYYIQDAMTSGRTSNCLITEFLEIQYLQEMSVFVSFTSKSLLHRWVSGSHLYGHFADCDYADRGDRFIRSG